MVERMNIVVVGHVDHGKSTLVGRLYADTGSLPDGKLEQIKKYCERNSKPFEYAFLLDALKDEQSQGITIDSSRSFFKTKKRDYDIIDAPGHIEFLKNMISGAARAEAAILLIDAKEGIKENSKRHAYLLSMLGISQIIVCVNKMDLVNYDENIFEEIKKDYSIFLKKIGVVPKKIIPISAFNGENLAKKSKNMNWYKGLTLLDALDSFEKEKPLTEKPFRMFLQDVYKFTNYNDDRRVFAGRVSSGKISVGDRIIFLPSFKESKINSIEGFNEPVKKNVSCGYSTGFTLTEQIFVKRGELMCKLDETRPFVGNLIKANIFWMNKKPFEKNKEYKLKIGTDSVKCYLNQVLRLLDPIKLEYSKKSIVERHDVAECIIECSNSIVFEKISQNQELGRFVIVDDYVIMGGGVIIDKVAQENNSIIDEVGFREKKWYKSDITSVQRANRFLQEPLMILITGKTGVEKKKIGVVLEKILFEKGKNAYFLPIGNLLRGLDKDVKKNSTEHIRRLGELTNILIDTGLIVIVTLSDVSSEQLNEIKSLVGKNTVRIISVDDNSLDFDLFLTKGDSNKNASKIYNYLFIEKKPFLENKNIFWQDFLITNKERENLLNQKGLVLWMTGLSGSGKSTIASELQKKLFSENKLSYVLDGDNIRYGLNKDLGFEPNDRVENIRRVGEVSKLFYDCGIITIVTFISPYKKDRDLVREMVGKNFIEIYVKCPIEECIKRDSKGLYKKALNGEISNFTGVNAPYEEPVNPEIIINSLSEKPSVAVLKIFDYLTKKRLL